MLRTALCVAVCGALRAAAAPDSDATLWPHSLGARSTPASAAAYCGAFLVTGTSAARRVVVHRQTDSGWGPCGTLEADEAGFGAQLACVSGCGGEPRVAVASSEGVHLCRVSAACGVSQVALHAFEGTPVAFAAGNGSYAVAYADGRVVRTEFEDVCEGAAHTAHAATRSNATRMAQAGSGTAVQTPEGTWLHTGVAEAEALAGSCDVLGAVEGAGLQCTADNTTWVLCRAGGQLYATSAEEDVLRVRHFAAGHDTQSEGWFDAHHRTATLSVDLPEEGTFATLAPFSRPAPAAACNAAQGGVVVWQGDVHLAFLPRQHGGWGEYGAYSKCTAACGEGTQTRVRTCTSPAAMYGGSDCDGTDQQTRACTWLPTHWEVNSTAACDCTKKQQREIFCRRCDGQKRKDAECTETPPASVVACTPELYDWKVTSFAGCTATARKECQGIGQETRTVWCADRCTGLKLSDTKCDPLLRPERTQFCTGMWHEWVSTGKCIANGAGCDGKEEMVCQSCLGVQVSASLCAGVTKPQKACRVKIYTVSYTAYGICDNTCGKGSMWRQAKCYDRCATGTRKYVPLPYCGVSDVDLTLSRDCTVYEGGNKWGDWVCSVTACGKKGTKTRDCLRQCDYKKMGINDCSPRGVNSASCSTPACPPDDDDGCYPVTAELLTPDGPKQAGQLTPTDRVMACTAGGACGMVPLHGVLHRSRRGAFLATQLTHASGIITLSPDHFVYTPEGRLRAGEVAVGGEVLVHSPEGGVVPSRVLRTETVTTEAFISHMTPTMTLLVRMEGTWTLVSEHSAYDFPAEVMDFAFAPFHSLFALTGDIDGEGWAEGADHLHLWPRGLLWVVSCLSLGAADTPDGVQLRAGEGLGVLGVVVVYYIVWPLALLYGTMHLLRAVAGAVPKKGGLPWAALAVTCLLLPSLSTASAVPQAALRTDIDYRMRIKSETHVKHEAAVVTTATRWATFDLSADGGCHSVRVRTLFESAGGGLPQSVPTEKLNECPLHMCVGATGDTFLRDPGCKSQEHLQLVLMLRPLALWNTHGGGRATEVMHHSGGQAKSHHIHDVKAKVDTAGLRVLEVCTDTQTHETQGMGMESTTCATLSREHHSDATTARTASVLAGKEEVALDELLSSADIKGKGQMDAEEMELETIRGRLRHLLQQADGLQAAHEVATLVRHRWEEVHRVLREDEVLERPPRVLLEGLAFAATAEALEVLEECVAAGRTDLNTAVAVAWQASRGHDTRRPSFAGTVLRMVERERHTGSRLQEPHLVAGIITKHSSRADQARHTERLLAALPLLGSEVDTDVLRSLPAHTARHHTLAFVTERCTSAKLGCGSALRLLERHDDDEAMALLMQHAGQHPHPDAREAALSLLSKRRAFGCREAEMLHGNLTTLHVGEQELVGLLAAKQCGRLGTVQQSFLSFDKTFGIYPLRVREKRLGGGLLMAVARVEFGVYARLAADILGGFFEFDAKAVAHASAEVNVLGFTVKVFEGDFRLGKYFSMSYPALGDLFPSLGEGRQAAVLEAGTDGRTAVVQEDYGMCTKGGLRGKCLTKSKCTGTQVTPGLCAGPADVQCCTYGTCTSGGTAGKCIPTSECGGKTASGLCPGPSDVKCCTGKVTASVSSTAPKPADTKELCTLLKARGFVIDSSCSGISKNDKDLVQAIKLFKTVAHNNKQFVKDQNTQLSTALIKKLREDKVMWQHYVKADCVALKKNTPEPYLRPATQQVLDSLAPGYCKFWRRALGASAYPTVTALSPPKGGAYPSIEKPIHPSTHRSGAEVDFGNIPNNWEGDGTSFPAADAALFHAEAMFRLTRHKRVTSVGFGPWKYVCVMVNILNGASGLDHTKGTSNENVNPYAANTTLKAVATQLDEFFTKSTYAAARTKAHTLSVAACKKIKSVSAYNTWQRKNSYSGHWSKQVKYLVSHTDHYHMKLNRWALAYGVTTVAYESMNRLHIEWAGEVYRDGPAVAAGREAATLGDSPLETSGAIPTKRIQLMQVSTCIPVVFFCLELSIGAALEIGVGWQVGLDLPSKQLSGGIGPNARVMVIASASASIYIAKAGVELVGTILDCTIPVSAAVDLSDFPLKTALSVPLEIVPFQVQINAFIAYLSFDIGWFYIKLRYKKKYFTIYKYASPKTVIVLYERKFPTDPPQAAQPMPQVVRGSNPTFAEGGSAVVMETRQWPGANTPVTKYCGRFIGSDGNACGAETCNSVPTLQVPTEGCQEGWGAVQMSAEGSTGKLSKSAGRQLYVVADAPNPVLDMGAESPQNAAGCHYRTNPDLMCVKWDVSRFASSTTIALHDVNGTAVVQQTGQLGRRYCFRKAGLQDGGKYTLSVTATGITSLSASASACIVTDFRIPNITQARATCGTDPLFQADLRQLCFSARITNVPMGGFRDTPQYFVSLSNGSYVRRNGTLVDVGGGALEFRATVTAEADLPLGRHYAEAMLQGKAGSATRVPLGGFYTFTPEAPESVVAPACLLPGAPICVVLKTRFAGDGIAPRNVFVARAVVAGQASTAAVSLDEQQCFTTPTSHGDTLRVGVAARHAGTMSAFTDSAQVQVTAQRPSCAVLLGGVEPVPAWRYTHRVCFAVQARGCGLHSMRVFLTDPFGTVLVEMQGPALARKQCMDVGAGGLQHGTQYVLHFTAVGGNGLTCGSSYPFVVDTQAPQEQLHYPRALHASAQRTSVQVVAVHDTQDTAQRRLNAMVNDELVVPSVTANATHTVYEVEGGASAGVLQLFYRANDDAGNTQRIAGRVVVWAPESLQADDIVHGTLQHALMVSVDRMTVSFASCAQRVPHGADLDAMVPVAGLYGGVAAHLPRAAAAEGMRRCHKGWRLVRTGTGAAEAVCEANRVLLAVLSPAAAAGGRGVQGGLCRSGAWGAPPRGARGQVGAQQDVSYCSPLAASLALKDVVFTSPGHADVQTVGNCMQGGPLLDVLGKGAASRLCHTVRFGAGHPAVDADLLSFNPDSKWIVNASASAGVRADGSIAGAVQTQLHNPYVAVWGIPLSTPPPDSACPVPQQYAEVGYACSVAVLDADDHTKVHHRSNMPAGQHSVSFVPGGVAVGESVVSQVTCTDAIGFRTTAVSRPSVVGHTCSGNVQFTRRAYRHIRTAQALMEYPRFCDLLQCSVEVCVGVAPYDCSVLPTTVRPGTPSMLTFEDAASAQGQGPVFLLAKIVADGQPACELPISTADIDATPPAAEAEVDCGLGVGSPYARGDAGDGSEITCVVAVSGTEDSGEVVQVVLEVEAGTTGFTVSETRTAVLRNNTFAATFSFDYNATHADQVVVRVVALNDALLETRVPAEVRTVDVQQPDLLVSAERGSVWDAISGPAGDEDMLLVNGSAPTWCMRWSATHSLGAVVISAAVGQKREGLVEEGTDTVVLCLTVGDTWAWDDSTGWVTVDTETRSGLRHTTLYKVVGDSAAPEVAYTVQGLRGGAISSTKLCLDASTSDDHGVRKAWVAVADPSGVAVATARDIPHTGTVCVTLPGDGAYTVALHAEDEVGWHTVAEQDVRVVTRVPPFGVEIGCKERAPLESATHTVWPHNTLCVSHDTLGWVDYAVMLTAGNGSTVAVDAGTGVNTGAEDIEWAEHIAYTVHVVATDSFGLGLRYESLPQDFYYAATRTEVEEALVVENGAAYDSVLHVSGEVCMQLPSPPYARAATCRVVAVRDSACDPQSLLQAEAECTAYDTAQLNDTVGCVALQHEGLHRILAQCTSGLGIAGAVAAGVVYNEVTLPQLAAEAMDTTPDAVGYTVRCVLETQHPGQLQVYIHAADGELAASGSTPVGEALMRADTQSNDSRSVAVDFAVTLPEGVYAVTAEFATLGGLEVAGNASFQSVSPAYTPTISVQGKQDEEEQVAQTTPAREAVLLGTTADSDDYTVSFWTVVRNTVSFNVSGEFAPRRVGFCAGTSGTGCDVVPVTWLPLTDDGGYEAEVAEVVPGDVFVSAHYCMTDCSSSLLGVYRYDLTPPVLQELQMPAYAAPGVGQTVWLNNTFHDEESGVAQLHVCLAETEDDALNTSCIVNIDLDGSSGTIPFTFRLPEDYTANEAVACVSASNAAGLTSTATCFATNVSDESPEPVVGFGIEGAPLQGQVKPGVGVTLSSGLSNTTTGVPLRDCTFVLSVNGGPRDASEPFATELYVFPAEVVGNDTLEGSVCCTLQNGRSACANGSAAVLMESEVDDLVAEGHTLSDFGSVDITPPQCTGSWVQVCNAAGVCSTDTVYIPADQQAIVSWGGCIDGESELLYNCSSVSQEVGTTETTVLAEWTSYESTHRAVDVRTANTTVRCTAVNRFALQTAHTVNVMEDSEGPVINSVGFSGGCLAVEAKDSLSGMRSLLFGALGEDWTGRHNGTHLCYADAELPVFGSATLNVTATDKAGLTTAASISIRRAVSYEATHHDMGSCTDTLPTLCPARLPDTDDSTEHNAHILVDGEERLRLKLAGCLPDTRIHELVRHSNLAPDRLVEVMWYTQGGDLLTRHTCATVLQSGGFTQAPETPSPPGGGNGEAGETDGPDSTAQTGEPATGGGQSGDTLAPDTEAPVNNRTSDTEAPSVGDSDGSGMPASGWAAIAVGIFFAIALAVAVYMIKTSPNTQDAAPQNSAPNSNAPYGAGE